MNDEGAEVNLDEIIVLNKYDGDLSDDELVSAKPLETVTVKNGEIIEHIVWEEVK